MTADPERPGDPEMRRAVRKLAQAFTDSAAALEAYAAGLRAAQSKLESD